MLLADSLGWGLTRDPDRASQASPSQKGGEKLILCRACVRDSGYHPTSAWGEVMFGMKPSRYTKSPGTAQEDSPVNISSNAQTGKPDFTCPQIVLSPLFVNKSAN